MPDIWFERNSGSKSEGVHGMTDQKFSFQLLMFTIRRVRQHGTFCLYPPIFQMIKNDAWVFLVAQVCNVRLIYETMNSSKYILLS